MQEEINELRERVSYLEIDCEETEGDVIRLREEVEELESKSSTYGLQMFDIQWQLDSLKEDLPDIENYRDMTERLQDFVRECEAIIE